ncbi:MAG: VWA domain-containing protein [Rhodocyclaceae bacterium]|nr:VWA domain-containing protein [Rhodocyclaceae bacterium]
MTAAPTPLLFNRREARLRHIEALPVRLRSAALTHSCGALEPRLAGLLERYVALLAGRLPAADAAPWPPAEIGEPLDAVMHRLALPDFCAGHEELAETVLMGALFHTDFIPGYVDRGVDRAQAITFAIEAFAADWQSRCGDMKSLVDVFGDLGDLPKHARWDRLRGLLRSDGWQEVVRIRQLLERLPELARLIRGLGRARVTELPDERGQQTETVVEPAQARVPEARNVHVPDLPGETQGVCRSDRIARMLPAEALLLGHPRLRLVWHARRAERSLLAYEDDDRMSETHLRDARVERPVNRPCPDRRLEMGPLIVCVDTSGSMQGGAEAVAKAVVLEAMRTAHAQSRDCRVVTFGGEGELIEMDLPLDPDGLERLTRFLGQAYRGGTDICGPLAHCIDRISEARWQLADLLVASDGEFGATPDVVDRLEVAKREQGLRVQGVLIGDRETIGFLEIADHIHWVRDWRHFGGRSSDSPVHSQSLTSMYFPGALRNAATRAGTVSAQDASAAVRRGERQAGPAAPAGEPES